MKSRQVTFYAQAHQLSRLMAEIQEHVIPRFGALPHFLGLTVLKHDHRTRSEVIVTSFWDDGLEGSEEESSKFVEEIQRVTGGNPARKAYDTLYAQVRDSAGVFRLYPVA